MKSQSVILNGEKQSNYAKSLIDAYYGDDDTWVVDFKKNKEAKTMQQLRGLFGTWYDYLSETLGETKDELHSFHKIGDGSDGGWLLDIYRENEANNAQKIFMTAVVMFERELNESWSDFVMESYVDHLKRISLSWATIDQMREYMTRIEHYYMNAGYPLPILEKYKRWYR